MRKKLTASVLAKLKVPEGKASIKLFDSEVSGFGVRLMSSGVSSFIFEKRPKGSARPKQITIGRCTDMSVGQARLRAREYAFAFSSGNYLATTANLNALPLFEDLINQFDDIHLRDKSARYRSETLGYLRRYSIKPLSGLRVDQIRRNHVSNIITPLMAKNMNPTAQSVWGATSAVLSFAVRLGYIDGNPLIGSPPNFNKKPRERVLTLNELLSIWDATNVLSAHHAAAVRLLILVPMRKSEMLGSVWSEFADNWLLVPSERTKNGDQMPLFFSKYALEQLPNIRNDTDIIFSTNGKTPMVLGSKVKNKLEAELNLPQWQFHDFRRAFSTIMHEQSTDHFAIEACLNHRDNTRRGVSGVYNRAEYRDRKKATLQQWSDIVEAAVGRN